MDDFKKFMFKRQNTDKSLYSHDQEIGSQLFGTWNNLETFDEDALGSTSRDRTTQSLYLDDEDEVPIIPDIEELQDNDFILQTAEAPTVEINRIDNIDELNKKVLKSLFLSSSDNIDLSILAKFCLPKEKVRENDVSLTLDSLFTDIMHSDEINLSDNNAQENVNEGDFQK